MSINPEKSMMYLLGSMGLSGILSDGLIDDKEYNSLMGKLNEGLRRSREVREDDADSEGRSNKTNVVKYVVDGKDVPLWEKKFLSLGEAAKYFGIGESKLRELTAGDYCELVVWNGNKRLIKRERFEDYLEAQFSV